MRLARVLFASLAMMLLLPFGRAQQARVVQTLDANWTFQYFPQQEPNRALAKPEADDSHWPAVALPHTWSVYETTRELHPFIQHATEREDSYWWYGWGWYRKHLRLNSRLRGKEVFLEFDGVQKVSFIYVNGQLAGEHKGGYTSFSLDVTKLVRFGQDNVIAVQVSNRRDDNLGHVPPMTAGNFDVYGGIYRSVRLVLTNKVHVPFQGSAESEGGSFIRTPNVSEQQADVVDTSYVRNDGAAPVAVEVRTQLLDAQGSAVATETTPITLSAGELHAVEQAFTPIAQPHLWSPDHPYLYRAVSTVLEHGVAVDRFESTFGVRWFSWNHEQRRLYLNGKPIRLIGTNRHQEFPWLGDAMPVWMQIRDLKDMRYNMGFNFQRTAHYPQDPAVYDFCDRNGIIVLEESPNIKDIDFGKDVQKQTMREMIRRDRNHPSILFWGMGNETDHPADSAWAWAEDQTRIINLRRGTHGGDHVMTTDADLALEQTLRCTVRGWYNDDAHNFAPGTGEPASGQVTGTEEWQHETDTKYLLNKADDNVVVFLYADHGADRIYKNAPLKYVNPKGWVDGLRFPKYVYYLWQANFIDRPMVFMHPWPWQQRYIGKREPITIDSNADSVELFVDGRRIGSRTLDAQNAHTVEFPGVQVTAGTLRAVAHKGQVTVEQTLRMAGVPARLVLREREGELTADRGGVAVLDVEAQDANGVPVSYIHPEIHWQVSGEARLVGPAVYRTDTDKNSELSGTMYIDLPTANVIRTTNRAGAIHVTVSSPGLESASLDLVSTQPESTQNGIEQPALLDEGRVPVERDPAFAAASSNKPPRVFDPIAQDYKLPAATPEQARSSMEAFLHDHDPKLPKDTRSYDDALSKLTDLLYQNNGNLIADWYNFTADRYEDVALLSAVIDRSKIAEPCAEELKTSYADRILVQGEAIDLSSEVKTLGPALDKGQVYTRGPAEAPGVQHTSAATVGQWIGSVYPAWSQLTPAQQQKVLQNVWRLNPALQGKVVEAEQVLPERGFLLFSDSMQSHH